MTAVIGELEFLTKLQRILNEGLFVASYKYALLLSLAELSVEKDAAPDGTLRIELDELAERFITLYWRQVAPFSSTGMLLQNTGDQAAIINGIDAFKSNAATLSAARRHANWMQLVRQVRSVLRQMPLMKLQLVGGERLDFLYEERVVDRKAIVLRPGVASCFRSQFTIVQALVQQAWLLFVQRLNGQLLGSASDLSDFLFGSDRTRLAAIAAGLRDLQSGLCFYCGGSIIGAGEVDHFIPWSRYHVDLGHNFVLAHRSCNQDKCDMLAARIHLNRWTHRMDSQANQLVEVFEAAGFPHDADASSSVTLWAYEKTEKDNALVWVSKPGETSRLTPGWKDWFS